MFRLFIAREVATDLFGNALGAALFSYMLRSQKILWLNFHCSVSWYRLDVYCELYICPRCFDSTRFVTMCRVFLLVSLPCVNV